ncbi:MAG: SCO1664 family protein [Chloroflexota bacterium]
MDPVRSSDSPYAEDEARLRELPEIELLGIMRRSSNYTFLARLGPEPQVLAVYKPAAGESPLWDFPTGTLYRRELAAYLLARELGWPRVPPTVVRENAPHGVGALQLFVDADLDRHYLNSRGEAEATWKEIALFDVLANNADRKSGHCLTDPQGRVWVIDHGVTFHTDDKLRTVIWDFAGRTAPKRLRADVRRTLDALDGGAFGNSLRELLSAREVRALRRRLAAVLEPGWRFPEPGSAWSVPWPPV